MFPLLPPFFHVADRSPNGSFTGMERTLPNFALELAAFAKGISVIAGIDEVGRGPLAGPVTAAAVILDPDNIPDGLDDSKKLTKQRRERLARQLHMVARVSIAHASVEEIEQINILRASHLAMMRAVAGLTCTPDLVLIDGNMIPEGMKIPATPVIGGDGKSLSICAASIVAKTCRDQIMVDLAQQFPGYGWETNVGYGSKKHMEALQNLGVTPHHRRSFKPVHNILYQEKSVSG